jgi:hypothetical protein
MFRDRKGSDVLRQLHDARQHAATPQTPFWIEIPVFSFFIAISSIWTFPGSVPGSRNVLPAALK